jgi:hypothetical protein
MPFRVKTPGAGQADPAGFVKREFHWIYWLDFARKHEIFDEFVIRLVDAPRSRVDGLQLSAGKQHANRHAILRQRACLVDT